MHTQRFTRRHWIVCLKTAAVILIGAAIGCIWTDVAKDLLSLIFGTAIVAFMLTPLARLLEKKLNRAAAALIALIGTLTLLTALLALTLPSLFRQLRSLVEQLPQAFSRVQTLLEHLEARLQQQAPGLRLPEINFSGASGSIAETAKGAISTVRSAANILYRLFLTLMLSYFFIADREHILLHLELMVPQTLRRSAVRAGSMLMRELRLYLRGQATIALAVGAISALGLWCIGLKGAPLLGALVGILNAIPYLGPFLGGIPAVLSALGVGWQKAALTVLILFLVQQIDGMLISPRIMGSVTGFSPAVVMLALFAGARIGSIFGMLLAMPTLMAVRTLYRVFVQRHEKD